MGARSTDSHPQDETGIAGMRHHRRPHHPGLPPKNPRFSRISQRRSLHEFRRTVLEPKQSLVDRFWILDFRFWIEGLKKATPRINPGVFTKPAFSQQSTANSQPPTVNSQPPTSTSSWSAALAD